ncbi:alpha/beta hydrolase [Evansella sp. AB-P1]|uniref:poly(ethylene terephthalate) hydrolase family protein n=1 Tax=Evansella sp. AB-P1 TaxID=3037653 RepID=UPI00241C0E97|nr:alpha/beta hydrolase [Evansella sp. AB-P1]MDG5788424.1 alpha/beta hydrolase [Evansella sp. AB-P1]
MAIPTNIHKRLNLFFQWFQLRCLKTLEYDTRFWLMMSIGLYIATSVAAITTGIGNPIGLGILFDIVVYFILNLILIVLCSFLFATTLSFMYVPVPRLFVSNVLYTGLMVYYVLNNQNVGTWFSMIIAISFTVLSILLGMIIGVLTKEEFSVRKRVSLTIFPLFIIMCFIFWPSSKGDIMPVFSNNGQGDYIIPLTDNNPSDPGPYSYTYFTYGNGQDNHRGEFGEDVTLISDSVDASGYSNTWSWERKLFWGFDEKNLPLNGRVWMPEGEGKFPLVLITHGNHTMENFSDDGYGYLGELLASRGFIAISIDQNFLNYSNWTGSTSRNYELRAWFFLHHLLQIEKFNSKYDNPFSEKVDMGNIALIGHSRGGQAAVMAADYTTWFSEDDSLDGVEDFGIQAVVGLAPTDRRTDGKSPALENTYYLVLHGSYDGDVNNFRGDRQYNRTYFEQGSTRFKSYVYIENANHSQFNEDWGRRDMSLPGGLFLDGSSIMDASDQREIAMVYISAFLETALHGDEQYVPLFKDYRYGLNWLPATQYISRYESGEFVPLVRFNRNQDKESFHHNITAEATGFATWEVKAAEDRRRNNKNTDGVVLEWYQTGEYSINISEEFYENVMSDSPEKLTFSMANLGRDMEVNNNGSPMIPTVNIELETKTGSSFTLDSQDFYPSQFNTQYTKFSWSDQLFRDGKYSESNEPIFQTYILSLSDIEEVYEDFQPDSISKITFHFKDAPGKVMIDDIGFY